MHVHRGAGARESACIGFNPNAALIVSTGNIPQIDDNVIANACSAGVGVPGPDTTVQGCFNTNHDQAVIFTVGLRSGRAVIA